MLSKQRPLRAQTTEIYPPSWSEIKNRTNVAGVTFLSSLDYQTREGLNPHIPFIKVFLNWSKVKQVRSARVTGNQMNYRYECALFS